MKTRFLWLYTKRWVRYSVRIRMRQRSSLVAHHQDHLIAQLQAHLAFDRTSKKIVADASVLIAITNEAEPKVLFTHRASHLNSHSGEVAFPGGKRDAADTSNIVVALREAQEETGLNPFQVQLLGELPAIRSKAGLTVKPIVGLIAPDTALHTESEEIDSLFFVPLRYFLEHLPTPYAVVMQGKYYRVPSYQIEGEVIWGLTGMLLVSMIERGLGHYIPWPMMLLKPLKLRFKLKKKRK